MKTSAVLRISILFIGILLLHPLNVTSTNQSQKPEVWITVLIHGIVNIQPYLNFSNFVRLMRDKIANSHYERTVEIIRKTPFFFQHQAMQGLGLQKIDTSVVRPGATSSAYANIHEQVTAINSPHPTINHYYTFGWSGLLSSKIRYLEAQILYQSLLGLLEEYYEKGICPKIRIIGYSHGGTIALNLGLVYYQEKNYLPLPIYELILLGTPVIAETDYLVNCPIFHKIYHFYSYSDRVQRIELFSSHKLFSERKFKDRSNFIVPCKLYQIQFKLTRLLNPDVRCCTNDEKLCNYKQHRHTMYRKADPGHSEFFSFGWTPQSYRRTLPIYPFPASIFSSYIINAIHQLPCIGRDLFVDIRPFEQKMIIGTECKEIYNVPFVSQQTMAGLRAYAEYFRPICFDRFTVSSKMCAIIQHGKHLKHHFSCRHKRLCEDDMPYF